MLEVREGGASLILNSYVEGYLGGPRGYKL